MVGKRTMAGGRVRVFSRLGAILLTIAALLALSGCDLETRPTVLGVVAGDGQGTLWWTTPLGGEAVTGYRVTPYLGTTAQASTVFDSTATTQTVAGLKNGLTYTFAVAPIRAGGLMTAESASSDAVVPFRVGGVAGGCGPLATGSGFGAPHTNVSFDQHIAEIFTSEAAGHLSSVTLAVDAYNPDQPATAPLVIEFAEYLGSGEFMTLSTIIVDVEDLSPDYEPRLEELFFPDQVLVHAGQRYGVLLSTTTAEESSFHLYSADTDPTSETRGCPDDDMWFRSEPTGPFHHSVFSTPYYDAFYEVRLTA